MIEPPPEIAEFERLNLPMIVKFVRATLVYLSATFDGYIPPYIISYGLGKYGVEGYCEMEDGEISFITFDVFSGDLLDTICHEYAHAVGANECEAIALAREWSERSASTVWLGEGMANETVEKHLKEELHLRDDILVPRWCPRCRVMVLDPVSTFRYCPICKEVMVDVAATVQGDGVIFRRAQ